MRALKNGKGLCVVDQQRQGAIEAGYVNFGYFSPETSSKNEYPDYVKNAVDDAIRKIRSYQNKRSITFGFMADIHYSKTEIHDLRTKRLMNAYRDIKDAVGAELLLLAGDFINNGNKEYSAACFTDLKEYLCEFKHFPVNGNHDDNSMWDEYIGNGKAVNHHTTRELYSLFYNHLPEVGATIVAEDKLYYFYDDKENSVRYIFLDTSDIPDVYNEDGSLKYTKQHTFGISQEQIDWLINVALKTEEETDFVICAHNAGLPSEDEKSCPTKFLHHILDAHNQRGLLCREYGEGVFKVCIDADFAEYKGKVLCVMCGHYHKDIVEKSQGGIPFIHSDCTIMYVWPVYYTVREDGNISEMIFDMVTIDRENNRIYTTRIGAGEDRIIEYN